MSEKTWQTLSEEVIYQNDWIKVEKHDTLNPNNEQTDYTVVRFKNIAVGCIPVDEDGNIYLVGQWRYPLNKYSWEIPEGGADPNKNLVKECARELKEETGITAKKFKPLLTIHTSNSVTDEVAHVFMCIDLKFGKQDLDDTEDIQVKKIPFEQALKMVIDEEITDAISVASILKLAVLTKTNPSL